VFVQPACHCGTLLTGKVNAERHFFFTVGPPHQPTSLPALGFDERSLHPMAVEIESADASPVPALDHDLIAPDGHALVVAGMAFQVSEKS
jgi:hypothetical protein